MQDPLRVVALLGVVLIAAAAPAVQAQSEAGGAPNACYSTAIPTSQLMLNYTRSQTSAATTFSFLVQPKGALAGTVTSVGLRIASTLAASPSSIKTSVPAGQIQGPGPQFVWPALKSLAQVYSLALAAPDASNPPFYLTSLCQQGITVLDAAGKPVFQQPAAAAGQPGTCFLYFQMTDGSCGYQLLADRELPASTIPPPPPSAPAASAAPAGSYGYSSYGYGYGYGGYGYGYSSPPAKAPSAPLFGPPVSMSPPASYGSPPPPVYGYGSYTPAPPSPPAYGGYYGSPASSYGGYGSPPAAPSGGYYSATPTTLFGSGRSLLSVMPDETVLQASGLDHLGSAFPSNTWQFMHHKSSSGSMRSQGCPEPGATAEVACQAQRVCGKCSSTSSPDASNAFTLIRSFQDGKTVYNLTASKAVGSMPSRISLRVGSQSPSALTGYPDLSSHWLRGTVHRDCSSHTGLKHTIAWEQAAIKKAWSAGTPPLFQVEVAGDVDLFAEEVKVAGSEGAQLLIKPGVALLSLEDASGCNWQALDMRYA
ncbi:hypothetical protein WJX84_012339 [Apatococcus fuscideae]|uniref:Uncharacterized protein n=1 Tax=Apatococcus fuscideae TaxID=2026836 RepID=A0AAW1T8P7_9CHLO